MLRAVHRTSSNARRTRARTQKGSHEMRRLAVALEAWRVAERRLATTPPGTDQVKAANEAARARGRYYQAVETLAQEMLTEEEARARGDEVFGRTGATSLRVAQGGGLGVGKPR
jgi:hypothetical protein